MEDQPQKGTLVIDRPFGLVFLRAALILVVAGGLAEGLVRAAVAAGLIPPPRIGSVNAELDTKLLLVDRFIQQNGRLDCIFLGSSQFDEAVDPAVFELEIGRLGGQPLNCFNFSLGTMTAAGDGRIARLLAARYHPRLMFVGISARDFSDDFGELTRPLLDDPWVRYSLREITPGGWLTEHSFAYRGLLTLRSALNHDYMVFHDRLEYQLTGQGFLSLTGNDLSNPKKNFIPNFKFTREDLAGLNEIAGLNSSDLQIVVVEVPVNASFIPYYVQADPAAYRDLFIEPVSAIFARANLPFWQTQDLMTGLVPDSGWNDVKHLNKSGAGIFSAWLAGRTVQAIQEFKISLPAD
jgi:hypothetical protein